MPRSGPRKVRRYSDEFKLTAVRLSQQPGMQVQTVATARGVTVRVPARALEEARATVTLVDGTV